ncbi:MAG: 50S ribosomal protein L23 [Bacillota bacterium]
MEAREIIVKPIVTEKTARLMEESKYTFSVNPRANKTQIKKAVEEIFKVKVKSVNTMNVLGKMKRMGRFAGRRPNWKRAIVTLEAGQSIKVFEGV